MRSWHRNVVGHRHWLRHSTRKSNSSPQRLLSVCISWLNFGPCGGTETRRYVFAAFFLPQAKLCQFARMFLVAVAGWQLKGRNGQKDAEESGRRGCTHDSFSSCCQSLELLCGTRGLAKRAQEFTALESIAQPQNEVLESVA